MNAMLSSSPSLSTKQILLVEDNPGDVILVQEALQDTAVPLKLHVVENGSQAMDFLLRSGPHADAPKPDLILLDLNLPAQNGFEILANIRKEKDLKSIPVAIFTSSRSHQDIIKSYGLGALLFITKPLGFYEFIEAIRSVVSTLLRVELNS